jgi:hypothetical protein
MQTCGCPPVWLKAARRIACAALATIPLIGRTDAGAEWILLTSDEVTRTYLEKTPVLRRDTGQVGFRMRVAYAKPRDMMGLQYDSVVSRYLISCPANQVLTVQRFLLQDTAVVWTFPETHDQVPAEREIPGNVLAVVCP